MTSLRILNSGLISIVRLIAFTACVCLTAIGNANAASDVAAGSGYTLHPGDILTISVWKEDDLKGDVLVRPDGGISFPLVGDIIAKGRTVEGIREEIVKKITKYIPDPVVTVQVKQIVGNNIYVIGKVNKPGAFVLNQDIDVMQALSIAGGTTTFASLNKIIVLRRQDGKQVAIPFRYGDVESGEHLDQNIPLKSGDVVVVP